MPSGHEQNSQNLGNFTLSLIGKLYLWLGNTRTKEIMLNVDLHIGREISHCLKRCSCNLEHHRSRADLVARFSEPRILTGNPSGELRFVENSLGFCKAFYKH